MSKIKGEKNMATFQVPKIYYHMHGDEAVLFEYIEGSVTSAGVVNGYYKCQKCGERLLVKVDPMVLQKLAAQSMGFLENKSKNEKVVYST
jgi:hypothetical protein